MSVRCVLQISTCTINLEDIISKHRFSQFLVNHWAFCYCLTLSKSRSVSYIKLSFSIRRSIFLWICICMYVYIDIYIFLDVIFFFLYLWKFIVLYCCNILMEKYMFTVSNRTLPLGRNLFKVNSNVSSSATIYISL